MFIIFFNAEEIIVAEYETYGQTTNQKYYTWVFVKLWEIIWRKGP
jgi:hypothetical protein